jgi:hypothetical protein
MSWRDAPADSRWFKLAKEAVKGDVARTLMKSAAAVVLRPSSSARATLGGPKDAGRGPSSRPSSPAQPPQSANPLARPSCLRGNMGNKETATGNAGQYEAASERHKGLNKFGSLCSIPAKVGAVVDDRRNSPSGARQATVTGCQCPDMVASRTRMSMSPTISAMPRRASGSNLTLGAPV